MGPDFKSIKRKILRIKKWKWFGVSSQILKEKLSITRGKINLWEKNWDKKTAEFWTAISLMSPEFIWKSLSRLLWKVCSSTEDKNRPKWINFLLKINFNFTLKYQKTPQTRSSIILIKLTIWHSYNFKNSHYKTTTFNIITAGDTFLKPWFFSLMIHFYIYFFF